MAGHDRPTAGGDLEQVEVLETVFDEQTHVAVLEFPTFFNVGEVDQPALEPSFCRREHLRLAPSSRDRLGDQLGAGCLP
jgi:hypothetical protein